MYRAPPMHHYNGRLVRQPQQSPQKLLVTLNLLLGWDEPEHVSTSAQLSNMSMGLLQC